jgi:hypothetical protein
VQEHRKSRFYCVELTWSNGVQGNSGDGGPPGREKREVTITLLARVTGRFSRFYKPSKHSFDDELSVLVRECHTEWGTSAHGVPLPIK